MIKVKSYTDISKKWQKDANSQDPWRESEPVKVGQGQDEESKSLRASQRVKELVKESRVKQ